MPDRPKKATPVGEPRYEDRSHYGRRHVHLRARVLADRPICELCDNALSHHAHHLRYPALTVHDYQALCVGCHSKLHAQNQSRPPRS